MMLKQLVQPQGSSNVGASKEILSQLANISPDNICNLEVGEDTTGFDFGIDTGTKQLFNLAGIDGVLSSVENDGTTLSIQVADTIYQLPYLPTALLTVSIASLDKLRRFEPWYKDQQVLLVRAVEDGPIINALIRFDATDTASTDNDYSIFVTEKGKRWKADVSEGYDVRLAGYVKELGNFTEVVQKIINGIVSSIVADGTITSQQMTINIYGDSTSAKDKIHYLNDKIIIPTFVTLSFKGSRHFLKTKNDTSAFLIDNSVFATSHGLTWSMLSSGYGDGTKNMSNARKQKIFDVPSGLWISGLGKGNSTKPAIIFGQVEKVDNSGMNSDVSLDDLNIGKFYTAIQLGTVNTYNLYIRNCYIDGINYGIYIPNGSSTNSGETIHFVDSVISSGQSTSNSTGYGIYSDALAFNLTFSRCHIDYNVTAVLGLGPHATYSEFRFDNCWVEGMGTLVECDSMFAGAVPNIYFTSCWMDLRTSNNGWGGPRKMLSKGRTYSITFDKCKMSYYKTPNKDTLTVALAGTDSKSFSKINYAQSYFDATTVNQGQYPYPVDIASSIRGLALFSGTEGNTGPVAADSSNVIVKKTAGATVLYGPATDVAGQFQPLVITCAATTDSVYIYPRHKVILQRGQSIAGSCSIKLGTATGNVNVSAALLNYNTPSLTSNITNNNNVVTTTTTRTAVLGSTIDGVVIEDVLTYLSTSGTNLTVNDFVGVQPVWVSQNYNSLSDTNLNSGYEFSLPAIKITGFTGTISVALPFWWLLQ